MAETKINGREFQVGEVLATDALKLQMRLMKIIGSGVDRLPVILKGVGEKATKAEKDASNAAAVAAFTDIFVASDPDEIVKLVSDIVRLATVKRQSGAREQVDIDLDFTQNKSDLFPLVVFVLREVLGDFFSGLQVRNFTNLKGLTA